MILTRPPRSGDRSGLNGRSRGEGKHALIRHARASGHDKLRFSGRQGAITTGGGAASGPDEHGHARLDELPEFADLLVGERDAALGPVESLMDGEFLRVGAAKAMDADKAAEAGILGRRSALFMGQGNPFEFDRADHPVLIAAPSVNEIRIIQVHKIIKAAAFPAMQDPVGADRRLVIALPALGPPAALAARDAVCLDPLPGAFHDQFIILFGYPQLIFAGLGALPCEQGQ